MLISSLSRSHPCCPLSPSHPIPPSPHLAYPFLSLVPFSSSDTILTSWPLLFPGYIVSLLLFLSPFLSSFTPSLPCHFLLFPSDLISPPFPSPSLTTTPATPLSPLLSHFNLIHSLSLPPHFSFSMTSFLRVSLIIYHLASPKSICMLYYLSLPISLHDQRLFLVHTPHPSCLHSSCPSLHVSFLSLHTAHSSPTPVTPAGD